MMLSTLVFSMSVFATSHSEKPQAVIYDRGLYAWSRKNASVIISKNTTNPLRYEGGGVPVMLLSAERVPLVLGLSFGFTYDFPSFVTPQKMLWQVEHPPMTTPDGRISTGYQEERNIDISAGKLDVRVYTFDHPYEMVEGRWVFRYLYQGQLVLEQSFTTYKPSEVEATSWQQKLHMALPHGQH